MRSFEIINKYATKKDALTQTQIEFLTNNPTDGSVFTQHRSV